MLKVLIVDDERLEREALRKILLNHSKEYVVMGEASSANYALVLTRSMCPDVIIMDMKMPGMSSSVAIQLINKEFPEISIILLTQYNEKLETSESGLVTIEKPVRPKALYAILEELMKKKEKPNQMNLMMATLLQKIRDEDYKLSKELLSSFISAAKQSSITHDQMKAHIDIFIDTILTIYEEKGFSLPQFSKQVYEITSIDKAENIIYSFIEDLFTKIIGSSNIEAKKQIQCALNYIEKNYQRGVTLEEVAEHVHLSPHYLSRLFKKELNINFVNYVSERRINLAKEMLEKTDMSVLNIALELSYQEPNYFSKVFKKSTGMTPSEYRKHIESKSNHLLKRNYYIPNGKWYI